MRAVIIEQPGNVRVDDVPDPEIEPADVLIKVAACGICGTDIHIIDGEFPPTTYPIIPGHEFGGTVIEATGKTKVAVRAIDAVIRRGKLLLFGVCPPGETAAYDAFRIYNQEITILGTMAVLNIYGPAIDVIKAGAIDTAKMVAHTLPLDRFLDGVELVRRGEGLKIQIDPSL